MFFYSYNIICTDEYYDVYLLILTCVLIVGGMTGYRMSTPLLQAYLGGHAHVVTWLLSHGLFIPAFNPTCKELPPICIYYCTHVRRYAPYF